MFIKIARVAADIAKASGAVMIVRNGDRIVECRMAFGSVAPIPMRTIHAEQILIGQVFSDELATKASQLASDEVTPIDDVRSEAWYRREAVRVIAYEGLNGAWRCAQDVSSRENDESLAGAHGEASASRLPSHRPSRVAANEKCWIELDVNGKKHQAWVGPR